MQIEKNALKYWWGSKNKKLLRGCTQATIHPLAIILTAAHIIICPIFRNNKPMSGIGQTHYISKYKRPYENTSIYGPVTYSYKNVI